MSVFQVCADRYTNTHGQTPLKQVLFPEPAHRPLAKNDKAFVVIQMRLGVPLI